MALDVKKALTRKIGPQPAWAWLAEGGGALWLWRRKTAGATTAGATPADSTSSVGVPIDTGGGSGGGGFSGGGSGGGDTGGGSGGGGTVAPPTTTLPPDTTPQAPTSPAAPQPTATLTAQGFPAGNLLWGNTMFTSQAQFNAYLKSKGLSVGQFARNHPAAYAIYLGLPAGSKAAKAKHLARRATGRAKPKGKTGSHRAAPTVRKRSATATTRKPRTDHRHRSTLGRARVAHPDASHAAPANVGRNTRARVGAAYSWKDAKRKAARHRSGSRDPFQPPPQFSGTHTQKATVTHRRAGGGVQHAPVSRSNVSGPPMVARSFAARSYAAAAPSRMQQAPPSYRTTVGTVTRAPAAPRTVVPRHFGSGVV